MRFLQHGYVAIVQSAVVDSKKNSQRRMHHDWIGLCDGVKAQKRLKR